MDTAFSSAEPLWMPSAEKIAKGNLTRFQHWLSSERNIYLMDAGALYDSSIRSAEEFWSAVADFFGARFQHAATRVLRQGEGPQETRWFPGATLK
jgi:acetoacetyl-CoA synthetase